MTKEEFAQKYPRLLLWIDEDRRFVGYDDRPSSNEDYAEVDLAVTEDLKEFQGKKEEPRLYACLPKTWGR